MPQRGGYIRLQVKLSHNSKAHSVLDGTLHVRLRLFRLLEHLALAQTLRAQLLHQSLLLQLAACALPLLLHSSALRLLCLLQLSQALELLQSFPLGFLPAVHNISVNVSVNVSHAVKHETVENGIALNKHQQHKQINNCNHHPKENG